MATGEQFFEISHNSDQEALISPNRGTRQSDPTTPLFGPRSTPSSGPTTTNTFSNENEETEKSGWFSFLKSGNNQQEEETPTKTYNCFSIEYYSFLFDVDEKDVALRIFRSLVPFPINFWNEIQENPDLYGAVWISSTLVFILALAGNLADWIEEDYYSDDSDDSSDTNTTTKFYFSSPTFSLSHNSFSLRSTDDDSSSSDWSYDLGTLPAAAMTIYIYVFGFPILIWIMSSCWMKVESSSLRKLLCLYGYSISVYIPIAALCVIQVDWVRWMLVGIGILISTTFLSTNLYEVIKEDLGRGIWVILLSVIANIGLGLTFLLYFFVLR